jgi:hypothetical protein
MNLSGDLDCSPTLLDRLQALAVDLNVQIYLKNGYRSDKEQDRICNSPPYPRPCAAAGSSFHRYGVAADCYPNQADAEAYRNAIINWPGISAALARHGLCHPMSNDPPHVEIANGAGGRLSVAQATQYYSNYRDGDPGSGPDNTLPGTPGYIATGAGGSGGETASSGGSSSGSGGPGAGAVERVSKAAAFATYLELPGIMDTLESMSLRGERSLMNDQPLLPFMQQLCKGSLRHFQSAPNGTFFAFYPDYFGGLRHRTPYWDIHDIEIIDGRIQLSDDALATHVYTVGDTAGYFDGIDTWDRAQTGGVVTIFNAFMADFMNPMVIDTLVADARSKQKPDKEKTPADDGKADDGTDTTDPGDITRKFESDPKYRALNRKDKAITFLKKYGARPYKEEVPMVRSPFYEAFLAYQTFCLMWSRQFVSTFTLTFMPEVFPGGIVRFPEHGIQMYVDEVNHIFDYQTGFQTQVNFSAPAALPGNDRAVHGGLIRAGIFDADIATSNK